MKVVNKESRTALAIKEVKAIIAEWAKGRTIGDVLVAGSDDGILAHLELKDGCDFDARDLARKINNRSEFAECLDSKFTDGHYIWEANFYVRPSISLNIKP
jgi:hypothetical protein